MRTAAERLLAAGAEVAVPRVEGDELLPCPFRDWGELAPGTFGIATSRADAWSGAIDVVVAPGVAFDRSGGRLGLGRGYYDRLLATRAVGFAVGVCWDEQLVDAVPMEERDRGMDAVVTPTGVWRR